MYIDRLCESFITLRRFSLYQLIIIVVIKTIYVQPTWIIGYTFLSIFRIYNVPRSIILIFKTSISVKIKCCTAKFYSCHDRIRLNYRQIILFDSWLHVRILIIYIGIDWWWVRRAGWSEYTHCVYNICFKFSCIYQCIRIFKDKLSWVIHGKRKRRHLGRSIIDIGVTVLVSRNLFTAFRIVKFKRIILNVYTFYWWGSAVIILINYSYISSRSKGLPFLIDINCIFYTVRSAIIFTSGLWYIRTCYRDLSLIAGSLCWTIASCDSCRAIISKAFIIAAYNRRNILCDFGCVIYNYLGIYSIYTKWLNIKADTVISYIVVLYKVRNSYIRCILLAVQSIICNKIYSRMIFGLTFSTRKHLWL